MRIGGTTGASDGAPQAHTSVIEPTVRSGYRPLADPSPGQGARDVFAVVAAHGGCGASTVAALLDPRGADIAVEIHSGDKLSPEWTPVVVARSTAYGTFSANLLIADWPSG